MRMWMVDPKLLCRKHLLGEHVELHMFVGHLQRGRKLGRYTELCEPNKINARHAALAAEMTRRGFSHQSSLSFEYVGHEVGHVDVSKSLHDLRQRCDACRALIDLHSTVDDLQS